MISEGRGESGTAMGDGNGRTEVANTLSVDHG